jgi:hypothetical protein
MGEVRRKRPWEEEQEQVDGSVLETFLQQIVLCAFILIGLFIILNAQNSTNLRKVINTELTKNIELNDADVLIDYVKSSVNEYIR